MSAAGALVATTARLHLGFLDLAGDLGRRFGSIGLALDAFSTRVEMRAAPKFSTDGPLAAHAERLIRRLADPLGLSPDVNVKITSAIPAHAGLGSGTQLALALAAAFRRLHGLAPDTAADGRLLGRGARSGIGVGLFDAGGFMIDAGHGAETRLPPIIVRSPFPAEWRVLLILDAALAGAHGEAERAAFAALPPFPPASAAEICRRALMQIAPGVAEGDFAAFGRGVTAIQRMLGDHFASAQGGGAFTSAAVGQVAARLEAAGALGIGQSSWGPTGFAFARDPDEAIYLEALARQAAQGAVDVQIHAARARGADVASL